jgi:creatinine amidohydrolase
MSASPRVPAALAGLALAAACFTAPAMAAPAPADSPATPVGYSTFKGTIAEMTWPDVEKAAKGAVALWGIAVIEEHGPALPLGTDTYQVSSTSHQAQADLEKQGVKSLIVPPFEWGVNEATGGFPGSIDVRPEIVTELMVDVIKSLKNTGFAAVYCLPGHGDAKHNRAIYDAVKRSTDAGGIKAYMVTNLALVTRLGLDPKDPVFVLTEQPAPTGPPPTYIDGHSGSGEHSTMAGLYPGIVKLDVIPSLKGTNLGPADLAEWRKGYATARKITPLGYFGQPAEFNPERGRQNSALGAQRIADAIAKSVKAGR